MSFEVGIMVNWTEFLDTVCAREAMAVGQRAHKLLAAPTR